MSRGSGPMLRLRALTKRYPTGDLALDGVDLEVPQGQVMALIGPSGAGKSTLIRCVNRLVEPTSGEVRLDGLEVTALSRGQLRRARRRMGMIFQEFALVERLTVMENVLSGRLGYVGFWKSYLRRFPRRDIDQAFSFLERVGLAEFVDKRADALSGGQRQRVGIARALMQRPQLLLADEPTSSLDPKTSVEIMELLSAQGSATGIPVIVNIHDVELARRYATRIVGMSGGHVVYDGDGQGLDASMLKTIYGGESWLE